MKKNTLSRKAVFTAGLLALLLAASMIMAACDNGTTPAPSVSKPAALAADASYAQFTGKCDEVVRYCDANPGATNDKLKKAATELKTTASPYQSDWNSVKASYIPALNQDIVMLE